jgi:hypothetical protein
MKSTFIHKGDVGTIFRLIVTDENGVPIDLDTADVKYIYFQNPSGTKVQKSASFLTNGADGILQYITIAGDIDKPGVWSVQGYVETSLGKFFTEKVRFTVCDTLYVATPIVE